MSICSSASLSLMCALSLPLSPSQTHTHTHTHSEALQQAADAIEAALDQGVYRLRVQINLAQVRS